MSEFLVIGEALVDVFHDADGTTTPYPGGSPTNVAMGLTRLGHAASELCYIGDDEYGALLHAKLRDEGVREQPGALVAPASSVADVRLTAAGDAVYEFSVLWDVPTTIDWTGIRVAHAGSIALALEPGAEHVLELLRSRPAGVRVTIDPNVRPAFLPREGAAARLEPFFALADLVKLSDVDAEHLYPGLAADAVLDRMLELGASIAAMTRGPDGAVLATVRDRVALPALAERVVDTVGAGDAFMAALVSAVASAGGEESGGEQSGGEQSGGEGSGGEGSGDWHPARPRLEEYARFASTASAITVSRAGPEPPTRAEIDAALAGAAITAVATRAERPTS
jgi:fructokinase